MNHINLNSAKSLKFQPETGMCLFEHWPKSHPERLPRLVIIGQVIERRFEPVDDRQYPSGRFPEFYPRKRAMMVKALQKHGLID